MNVTLANKLATDMTKRLTLAPDFWKSCLEFGGYKGSPEYDYALNQAIVQRMPFEDEEWRRDAAKRVGLVPES